MSEEKLKSIWKKSWNGWRGLLVGWLLLTGVWILIFLVWMLTERLPLAKPQVELQLFVAGWAALTIVFLLATFIRWTCHWRNFKKFLFGLACFISLVALFYAEEDWRGKHDWGKFEQKQEAKGEKFDFKDFIPPPVPDSQNFAMAPVVTTCYEAWLNTNGQRQMNTNVVNRLRFDLGDMNLRLKKGYLGYWVAATLSDLQPLQENYRRLAAKSNLFAVPAQPQSPAKDVLLALSKYDATVEELRRAAQRPLCRFPLNYDTKNKADILLPQLEAMKSSALLLQLRAIAELQDNQSDKAAADIKLMFRLVEAIHHEPFLISCLVRISMTEIAIQPIYEGLANHQWSNEQLAALDAELAKLDFLADCKYTMRGEQASRMSIIDFFRDSPNARTRIRHYFEETDGWRNTRTDYALPTLALAYGPSGWFDQNKLNVGKAYAGCILPMIDNDKSVSPRYVTNAGAIYWKTVNEQADPCNILVRALLFPLDGAVRRSAFGQASVDLARTGIALERYRLAHGEYPASLAALAPQFIAAVPHDVIGGGPLHYRRDAAGRFVLYSIGWNERDDGGVVVFHKGDSGRVNISEGDWVWRYPQANSE